jgi:uncharacterized protein
MKRILTTICLTLAVLLGSAGASWSADFQTGLTAYLSEDYETALREFTPLAEQGDADAQYNLGLMYANGQGVPEDDRAAVKWYTLAAEQGFSLPQFGLGVMYANGEGVIQNNVIAHMLWNLAGAQGHENGRKNRDIVAEQMTPNDISKAQAMAKTCLENNYKGCGF